MEQIGKYVAKMIMNGIAIKDKKWANIMLSDGTYKSDTVKVGQVVKIMN